MKQSENFTTTVNIIGALKICHPVPIPMKNVNKAFLVSTDFQQIFERLQFEFFDKKNTFEFIVNLRILQNKITFFSPGCLYIKIFEDFFQGVGENLTPYN